MSYKARQKALKLEEGRRAMDNSMKAIMLALVILYVVSPIDACPGPIDDLLVVMLALASAKQ